MNSSLTSFPYLSTPIAAKNFLRWSSTNFYRTSYHDMASKSPVENKRTVVPGYAGHIPRAVDFPGLNKVQISRRSLSQAFVEPSPYLYSSTGFNSQIMPRFDQALIATTHKYGQATSQPLHPDLKPDRLTTTFRDSFKDPKSLSKPNWRNMKESAEFTSPTIERMSTRDQSGFARNTQAWTSRLKSECSRTEYREKYIPKPFHHNTVTISNWTLKRTGWAQ